MKKIIIIFAVLLCLASCRNSEERMPNVAGETVITGLSKDHWTYFSFEKGDVVGTSAFGDDAQDREWSQRKDWDLAICGEYIKTNGGTSGIGLGGIQQDTEHNFTTLTEAPDTGYVEDIIQIIRR